MSLKNKKVLITAGPTQVAIDSVRVITNNATAETGILLANKLKDSGAKVTLLLGLVNNCVLKKNIRVLNFRFFEELKGLIENELKGREYDLVIHSAAVSDYQPLNICEQKIRSGLKGLCLKLKPTFKIINNLKKLSPKIFLVGFKFEPEADKDKLIKEARGLIRDARLDLAVANSLKNKVYLAYLVSPNEIRGPFLNKKDMVSNLVDLIKGVKF